MIIKRLMLFCLLLLGGVTWNVDYVEAKCNWKKCTISKPKVPKQIRIDKVKVPEALKLKKLKCAKALVPVCIGSPQDCCRPPDPKKPTSSPQYSNWKQCGPSPYLQFNPDYSCCCVNQTTGKYCVRTPLAGHYENCTYQCNHAICF